MLSRDHRAISQQPAPEFPMRLMLTALAPLAFMTAAYAQEPMAPGPDEADAMRCARYESMDDGGRIAALQAIEPFGDDIGSEDEQAARDWADEVARQCHGHPDLSLTEAANAANQNLTGEDDN
jgi:hypothetical protein